MSISAMPGYGGYASRPAYGATPAYGGFGGSYGGMPAYGEYGWQ